MKNNLKKLFKTGILFLSLAFLPYGCQKDDTSENIESSDEIQNILSQKISLNEIPNSNQVSEVLRNLSTSINATNYLQRTIEPDSVSIDTNDILYMEYGNTHTLTFKLLANNPQYYIENIVLHYNVDTDTYDEYLLEYVITQEEFVDFSNGIPLNENTEVLITELDTGTVSTILGRSSCSRNCETIYVQCTAGGQHWPGEECDGKPYQVAYSYQECTITCNDDPTINIISAGPSGGGGGGNPSDEDVITNPNANEPCDTGSGIIGITGNDGCITTVDDEARNQLFDRLATYMTSQEQADWIVLEANINTVNTLNNLLDQSTYYNVDEYSNLAVDYIEISLLSEETDPLPAMQRLITFMRQYGEAEHEIVADYYDSILEEYDDMTDVEKQFIHGQLIEIKNDILWAYVNAVFGTLATDLVIPVVTYALFEATGGLAVKLFQKIPLPMVLRSSPRLNQMIIKTTEMGEAGYANARLYRNTSIQKAEKMFEMLTKDAISVTPSASNPNVIVAQMGFGRKIILRPFSTTVPEAVRVIEYQNFNTALGTNSFSLKFIP